MTAKIVSDDDLIAAYREHRNVHKVAKAVGLHHSGIARRLKRLALRGIAPEYDMTHAVPDGFAVKGVSTLYRPDGSVAAQWVKSTADAERREAIMREAVAAMAADIKPIKPRKPKGNFRADMLSAYVIGDPHVGMRAWAEECGADWDLAIAQDVHRVVVADLVERTPRTECALIVNLGDLMHYDGMEAKTPRSGHLLDADGRYNKMLRVAAEVMREAVDSALAHHKRVHVINAIGNHDETGSQAVALALSHRYHGNPYVTIDQSPAVYNYYRWGGNLIGIHHGHTCKADKLPGVMAADRAKDWGETNYRAWWTGHIHHESKREYPGVDVESFGTLAVADAYATAGGWRSRQRMSMINLHKSGAECGRQWSNPDIASYRLARAA